MAMGDSFVDFDHLALAAEHAFDNFARYYGELGGTVGYGGVDPGFHWSQVAFPTVDQGRPGGGLRFELLEPRDLHLDDFLRRFLDRNGPGPHHVTYKVGDFDAVLASAEAAGYQAVGVDRSNPDWKVGYLHPKQSHGIVVQLAQSASGREPPEDFGLTPSKATRPALLERIVLAVADLDAALALFAGPLGGATLAAGDEPLGRFVDLGWSGGGVLRLLGPTHAAARAWVGARLGRVHHVRFAVDEPGVIAGARPIGEGEWEVLPEHNLGTRLRLVRRR